MTDDSDLEFSPRGFAQFGDFDDSYLTKIRVYESSAAEGPHVWISFDRAGVQGIEDQSARAHLSMPQAGQLISLLTRAISYANSEWSGSGDEPNGVEETGLPLEGHELVYFSRERVRSGYGNVDIPYTEKIFTCSCGKVTPDQYGRVWGEEVRRKEFTQHLLEELGASFSKRGPVSPP